MMLTLCLLLLVSTDRSDAVTVSDSPRQHHAVQLTWTGPPADESDSPSPFVAYDLSATLRHASGETITVAGFFAADGNAADTSATGGDRWRVRFAPPQPGEWTATATLTHKGEPVDLAAPSVTFVASPTDAAAPDLRAYGPLRPAGRYFRQVGAERPFLFAGANSPETLLGYADFDGTYFDTAEHPIPAPRGPISLPSLQDGLHAYADHVNDALPSDPTWGDGRGRGILGGLRDLASMGANSHYFVTMNVNGDGRNVWPWTGPWEHTRLDVSKLAQWDRVFTHMQSLGLVCHVVLQETENDHILDRGTLGPLRRLYLREMVARFGHHPGLIWNLGEENLQTVTEQQSMVDEIRRLDPYGHPIVLHNDHYLASNIAEMFDPLLGTSTIDGTTVQDFDWNDVHAHTLRYVRESDDVNEPWCVLTTEMGGANFGLPTDADEPDHFNARTKGLWGNLMAGGGGVEWYFGWQNNSPTSDLSAETWRDRESIWRQSRLAVDFLSTLPLERMQPADDLTIGHGDAVLAIPGELYAIHLPSGGSTRLLLAAPSGNVPDGPFSVRWFNPRTGGELQTGSTPTLWPFPDDRGESPARIGDPPGDAAERGRDWVAIVRRTEPVFAADSDRIVIEAEHFETQTRANRRRWFVLQKSGPTPDLPGGGDPRRWTRSILSAASQASGSRCIRLLPDTRVTHDDRLIDGKNFSREPGQMAVLSYRIQIDQPGRYYVWARAFSTGTEDNGLHIGLDGDWPEHGRRMQWCEGKDRWTWSGAQRTEASHCGEPHGIYLDIDTPGVHRLEVSMREDGVALDQLLLTRDRDFTPGGPVSGERLVP